MGDQSNEAFKRLLDLITILSQSLAPLLDLLSHTVDCIGPTAWVLCGHPEQARRDSVAQEAVSHRLGIVETHPGERKGQAIAIGWIESDEVSRGRYR